MQACMTDWAEKEGIFTRGKEHPDAEGVRVKGGDTKTSQGSGWIIRESVIERKRKRRRNRRGTTEILGGGRWCTGQISVEKRRKPHVSGLKLHCEFGEKNQHQKDTRREGEETEMGIDQQDGPRRKRKVARKRIKKQLRRRKLKKRGLVNCERGRRRGRSMMGRFRASCPVRDILGAKNN